MNEIHLNYLDLRIFTEQDALDYCLLNSLNYDSIIELDLSYNELKDISGIRLFKNIEILWLYDNKITDISVLKYLNKLKKIYISNNQLTDISVLKYLTELKELAIYNNDLRDISVIQYLNLEILDIENLKLESDQIQYIKNLNNLKRLYCKNTFKDMSVLNQLNKNIRIIND